MINLLHLLSLEVILYKIVVYIDKCNFVVFVYTKKKSDQRIAAIKVITYCVAFYLRLSVSLIDDYLIDSSINKEIEKEYSRDEEVYVTKLKKVLKMQLFNNPDKFKLVGFTYHLGPYPSLSSFSSDLS